MKILPILFLTFLTASSFAQNACITSTEKQIYDQLNQYRRSKGLPTIPLSKKLTQVAQAHVKDLAENYDFKEGDNRCNMHSWSDRGVWSGCCYTDDHAEAACMWNKPKEIAGYMSSGYEIAHFNSAGVTASEAIEGWKGSKSHNEVMINLGIWKQVTWRAVGVGVFQDYAVIWFGDLPDGDTVSACK